MQHFEIPFDIDKFNKQLEIVKVKAENYINSGKPFGDFVSDLINEIEGKSVSNDSSDEDSLDEWDEEEWGEEDTGKKKALTYESNPQIFLLVNAPKINILYDLLEREIDIQSLFLNVSRSKAMYYLRLHQDKLTDKEYWENLAHLYSLHDYEQLPFKLYKSMFNADRPEKQYLMTDEERDFLNKLPEEVTIYRGMSKKEFDSGEFGLSWTLDKSIADFFVGRVLYNEKEKVVKELIIPKDKITAYFDGRQESEIIYIQ
jgi:hypothetical protein